MTKFSWLICFILIFCGVPTTCQNYGDFSNGASEFKIGFILEESNIDSYDVENALQFLRMHLNVSFDFVLKRFSGRDSFAVVKLACQAMRERAAFLIVEASCAATQVVQTLTDTVQVPVVYLPSFSSCSKVSSHSSTSFAMRVNNSLVYNRLGSILAHDEWNNYLILHDDFFSQSYITELDNVLQESVTQTNREYVTGGVIKIYDPETTKDMQDTIIGLNTNGLYTNFIVLASEENTLRLMKQSEKLGLFGLNYKWVLANVDLDVTRLRQISPQFNALLIVRQLPAEAYNPKSGFVKEKWNGINQIGVSRNLTYLLNAAQLAIEALNTTYMRHKTNYSLVQNLNCMRKNKFNDGPKIINQIKRFEVLEDGSSDFFGISNFYLGVTFFKKASIEASQFTDVVSQESHFEMYPHLDMLRFDITGERSLANWKRVDSYRADSFIPTWHLRKKVAPFRVGKTSLDGSTLKIVTVVEEPFIIKKKQPSGHYYYDGYCIDVLKAIQQQVAQQFNENFQYDIEEADGFVSVLAIH